MIARPMELADIPRLEQLYKLSGYPYELPDLTGQDIEDVTVVLDTAGEIVAAGVARRKLELFLLLDRRGHPLAKMQRVQMLHSEMCNNLGKKGFTEGDAFLPPVIATSWGRHLEKWFGWIKNSPSWTLKVR